MAGISVEFDGLWQKLDLLQGENSELVKKTDQFGVLEGLYGTTKEKYENLSIEVKKVLTLNSNLEERLRLESNNYKELEEDLRAAEKSKLDSESTASQELERAKKDNYKFKGEIGAVMLENANLKTRFLDLKDKTDKVVGLLNKESEARDGLRRELYSAQGDLDCKVMELDTAILKIKNLKIEIGNCRQSRMLEVALNHFTVKIAEGLGSKAQGKREDLVGGFTAADLTEKLRIVQRQLSEKTLELESTF